MIRLGPIRRCHWGTRSLSIQEWGEWTFDVEGHGICYSRKTLGAIKAERVRLLERIRTHRCPMFAGYA